MIEKASRSSRLTTAIVQFASSESWEEDKGIVEQLVASAKKTGAELIALPDHMDGVSGDMAALAQKAPEETRHQTVTDLANFAEKHKIWILSGGLFIKDKNTSAPQKDGKEKAFLRSFLISPEGIIKARYNRTHLFHVADSPSPLQREGDYLHSASYYSDTQQDKKIQPIIEIRDGLHLGLSSNFDLRFPDHYQNLAREGANVFYVPALFSVPHGEAHWDTLLRARAIETCSYIIAPAQSGPHACGRYSWGQSMIIDPWGRILCNAGGIPNGIAVATIDLEKITSTRKAMPCLSRGEDNRHVSEEKTRPHSEQRSNRV